MDNTELDHLLLSTQIALCGAVVPELRAVTVDIDRKADLQVLTFYYDAEVTDRLFDLASVASTEASCALDYMVEEHILSLKFPQKMPLKGILAFLRREPNVEQYIGEKRDFIEIKTPIARLCLLTQQSLLGKITPNLRELQVNINAELKKLSFFYIYEGEISTENFSLAKAAIEEVSNYYANFAVERRIERLDFPLKIEYKNDGSRIPFSRNEEFLSK